MQRHAPPVLLRYGYAILDVGIVLAARVLRSFEFEGFGS
jgi:hypothetical protein